MQKYVVSSYPSKLDKEIKELTSKLDSLWVEGNFRAAYMHATLTPNQIIHYDCARSFQVQTSAGASWLIGLNLSKIFS